MTKTAPVEPNPTLSDSLPVNIAAIRTDLGTQMRPTLNREYIADLAELYEDGVALPPLEVYHTDEFDPGALDEGTYILVDGFHRLAALRLKGRLHADCVIHPGSLRDALLRAAQVNEAHGLRRDRATKRKAVLTLLEDEAWRIWSDREIARLCLVSHTFVAEIRRSLEQQPGSNQVAMLPPVAPETRKGGDGKQYPASPATKYTKADSRKAGYRDIGEASPATTKPLSVEAVCGVIADWLQADYPDNPVRALDWILNGESVPIQALETYLLNTRALVFNWPDVLEAVTRVKARMTADLKPSETFVDFAARRLRELEEKPQTVQLFWQALQFAFELGQSWPQPESEAGKLLSDLVSPVLLPEEGFRHFPVPERRERHDPDAGQSTPTPAPAPGTAKTPSTLSVKTYISDEEPKPSQARIRLYLRDWLKQQEPKGPKKTWAAMLEFAAKDNPVMLKTYWAECGYRWDEAQVREAALMEADMLRRGARK